MPFFRELEELPESRLSGFWGFEEHGVVPDIVTMAKAAGNGHPLGFVLVPSDIAEDFRTCEVCT